MSNKRKLEEFVNLNPVSKTIRFKAIPIGKTEENIRVKRLVEEDEERALMYKQAKKLIDRYHQVFIDNVLSTYEIPELHEYAELFLNSDNNEEKNGKMTKLETAMRCGISNAFKKNELYKSLFGKEMITQILPNYLTDEEEKKLIGEFSSFTTAFSGFYENRSNMYSENEEGTAISYRIVNENLPKFLRNVLSFEKIRTSLSQDIFTKMEKEFEGYTFSVFDCFTVDFFNCVLTNRGIETYNCFLGGYTEENGTKVQGLNEYINLYNQQLGKDEKNKRLPRLTPLFKQILSDSKGFSFVDEEYTSDDDVCKDISYLISGEPNIETIISKIELLMKDINQYDMQGIFVKNGLAITDLSNELTGNWGTLKTNWEEEYDTANLSKKNRTEKYYDNRNKKYNSCKSFSLFQVDSYLKEYYKSQSLTEYISNHTKELADTVRDTEEKVKEYLAKRVPGTNELNHSDTDVEIIKNFLDSLKELERYCKFFEGTGKEIRDEVFYSSLVSLLGELKNIDRIYNRIRNYVTRKPYSTDKVKLYFQNPQFLGGWDRNKVAHYRSTMARIDGEYYLIVIDKQNSKILSSLSNAEENFAELLDYKLISGAIKSLPHIFFSKKGIEENKPSQKVLDIYNSEPETFLKGDNFKLEDCHSIIDYYKEAIRRSNMQKDFQFHFSETSSYKDISEFFHEVDVQGYSLRFNRINKDELMQLVDEGKIYLFKLYNKDFSQYSHGRDNLHTMFFKMLFTEEGTNIKLCGGAELFMRRASIKKKIVVHPAGQAIQNKNPLNEKKESTFPYDITKDKRFTKDQYEIHIPITLNRTAQGKVDVNRTVRELLKRDENPYIIGIDRGERNLLYVCVIDGKGNIVEQMSLNEIVNEHNGMWSRTDYHGLLEQKEKERNEARQQWKNIENIKELKEGYISQVVNKICELVLKYDAVIAMEDLNSGFKNSRIKVEKQVYQKFEKALITKFNYLCSKSIPIGENGSVTAGYQITRPFESFRSMGTQNGFIFYIPAWLTSKIDPTTGFVDLLKPKYTSIADAQEFIRKFDYIRFDKENQLFEFGVNYEKFPRTDAMYIKKWTLCSYGTRIKTFRNSEKNSSWDNIEFDLTKAFMELWDKYSIAYEDGIDLCEQICKMEEKEFFVELLELNKLMLQMRNSITGRTDVDYLISPVKGMNGEFYDSRKVNENLPKDADANGAYNIARKVLWAINVFKNTDADKLKTAKIAISNKEWLEFAQKNHG